MGDDKQRDTWLKAAWRRHNRPYECELTAKAVRTRHNSFMFDDVVLLDDRIVAEGKSAGREDGRNRGLKEGEGMGQSKGFRVLAEMGFCRGCCLAWLAMHEEDRGENKRRTCGAVVFLLCAVFLSIFPSLTLQPADYAVVEVHDKTKVR